MASPHTAPAVRLLSCGPSSTVTHGQSAIIIIGQAVIPEKQLNHTGFVAGAWLGCTLLFLGSCAGHLENARSAVGGQEVTLDSTQPNPSTLPASSTSASSLAEQPRSAALPPSALRFKAMILDENSNLILEGGEHVRVRLDVINTGIHLIENASASLTGTPAVIEQFPTTRLEIPPLPPGQTKSLEFVATLPLLTQPLHTEIHVHVAEGDRSAAPSQTLLFTVAPTRPGSDDIDQLPAEASSLQRRHTYLISIGLSSYLDRRILSRKYASRDAEMVARYFQTFGGVPSSNIHLLVDWKAFHSHMEKAFSGWLRSQPTSDAVVIVYFSGHAMVSQTGEVMLIPYDGAAAATTLYPLKAVESDLAKLNPKQAILIFDGKVSQLQSGSEMKVTPRWDLTGGNTIRLIAGEGLSPGLDDDSHQHGLFTYYLLRGLRGEADSNRNGEVTLGEITDYVRQKATWASKSQFDSAQRPQIIPALKPGDSAALLVLTALPSLTASEMP